MTMENEKDNGEAGRRYFIDMSWFKEQGRSFSVLATSRFSPPSQKRMPKTETALLNAIKRHFSQEGGFITPDMPLMEMVFRLFLANGNQPLALNQIQEELQQRLSDSGGPRDLSIPKLKRIIEHDHYYGLRPLPAANGEDA